jgi:hypothetical protein
LPLSRDYWIAQKGASDSEPIVTPMPQKMIEFSIGRKAKQPILDDKMSCSVKVVAGARNRLDLQLQELLAAIVPS